MREYNHNLSHCSKIARLGGNVSDLKKAGSAVVEVDYNDSKAIEKACIDASCVVSALSGLEDVIIGAQTQLLHAAIAANVPRFIP